jgi:hypothetical protein
MSKRDFNCAWCGKPDTYNPKDDSEVTPDNLICGQCFKDEEAAGKRDEEMAAYYNEQQRIRYEGLHLLDNDIDRISVVYSHAGKRHVLRAWNYYTSNHDFFDNGREDVKLLAKGYIEAVADHRQRSKQK